MRKRFLILISLSIIGLTGCPLQQTSTMPPATNGGGWILSTGYIDSSVIAPAPETMVSGAWDRDYSGAAGDPSSFGVTTDELGFFPLPNARVNASWQLRWISSLSAPAGCEGVTATALPEQGHVEEFNCILLSDAGETEASPFLFNPNPFNTAAPPSSVRIVGSGFDPTYGMPVAQYFDMNGNLVAEQSATSLSPDRTTLTFSTPSFTDLPDGTYAGVISNIASNGSYSYVGTTAVEVPAPFYRPTAYSDMASEYPNYAPTFYPNGPIVGTSTLGSTTSDVEAFDQFTEDQQGNVDDNSESGQCTWSGFPSHVDANALTLYIPYSITVGGVSSNAGYSTVTVTINGNTTTLYNTAAYSGSGVLTATIPAGTNLSTIQVTVSTIPENSPNPGSSGGMIEDDFWLDIYVQ